MSRPAVEVADILHAQGDAFVEQHPWLSVQQRSVLRAIARCRTAALGGHVDRCDACGHQAISYNSCRNRHCPKCQAQARERWLHARERELLDVPYVHVVFTLPHALLPLAYRNSAASVHMAVSDERGDPPRGRGRLPQHLGADIGVLSILHTWGQTLVRHPHVHCVVPAGGLSLDRRRWVHPKYAGFFLPVKVLSRVFRGKYVEALRRAYARGELDFAGATEHFHDPAQWHAFVDALFDTDWVVYAKPAFGGASAVLRYLGRYTHRVAISNHRLLAFDGECVTFQWKDYAHGDQRRTMTLTAMEFLRRFVQHILPRGFVRIRQSGFLASAVAPPAWRWPGPCIADLVIVVATPRVTGSDHRSPTERDLAVSTLWRSDESSAQSFQRSASLRSASASTPHDRPSLRLRPAPSSTWWPTSRARCASLPGSSPAHLVSLAPGTRLRHWTPTSRVRRRPRPIRSAHAGDLDSSSIAGRRASGFLPVSLSKVPRHPHLGPRRASCAEALPITLATDR